MELDLQITLRNLDKRLRSFTGGDDWTIAVYALTWAAGQTSKPFLTRVESLGSGGAEAIDLVAHAAWITRTTIIGDVAKIAESLREPSEIHKYHVFGVHTPAAGVGTHAAERSVIAAPCLDPRQTITNDRVPPRAIDALAVEGGVPAPDAIGNENLRYLVEQFAKSAASFLQVPARDRRFWFYDWRLPDLEIMPGARQVPRNEAILEGVSKVPTYSRVEVFPTETVRLTGYGKDFEPYRTGADTWLQFGPGLTISRAGLEAFARGWAQRRADAAYMQGLDTP